MKPEIEIEDFSGMTLGVQVRVSRGFTLRTRLAIWVARAAGWVISRVLRCGFTFDLRGEP